MGRKKLEIKPGQRFGKWTVIGDAPNRNDHQYVEAKCSCGNTSHIRSSELTGKRSTQCKSCVHRLPTAGLSGFNRLFRNYKNNALRRRHSFELSSEQFRSLVTSDCYYCGQPPSQLVTRGHGKHGDFQYNGIDRVRNDVGYSLSNCVPCCKTCNVSKSTLSFEEFRAWLARLAANFILNVNPNQKRKARKA